MHIIVSAALLSCTIIIADNSSAEEKEVFMDEIQVMKRVSDGNNPHVLKMLGCVTTTNPMMLVLQFVPHGNLKAYLRAINTEDGVRNNNVILPIAMYTFSALQLQLHAVCHT